MKRRDASHEPSAPPSSAAGRWLLVGALGPGAVPAGTRLVRAAGVHAALGTLAWQRFEQVWVDGAALRDRPRAALRALKDRAPDVRLAILARAPSARLARAAAAAGVEIVDPAEAPPSAARRTAAPAPPTPPERGTASARPPEAGPAHARLPETGAAHARPPETGAASARLPEAGAVLPRADADAAAPPTLAAGEFAMGCLARVARPGALAAYLLRTLAEASDAGRVSLLLRDGNGQTLVLRAARGLATELLGTVRVPLGVGVAGRAAALGRPMVGLGSPGGERGYPGSAYVVLPLASERGCEGVASLTGFPDDRLPGEEAVRAWSAMATQAGRALHAARRLRRAEVRSARDALTGLPNRRAFEGALRRELDRARRGGRGLGVALLDVDRFKGINDTHGHPAGDRVLAEVARRLKDALRESDLVARWGGEEFALLLPDLGAQGEEEARIAVERARRAVSARPIALGAGLSSILVTVSGGVAVGPGGGDGGALLVNAADQALLRAKQGGRNRVETAPRGA